MNALATQDAANIFDIASKVSTPLALAGFLAACFFLILRQVLKTHNLFPRLEQERGYATIVLIIERLFLLALVALVLGFAGYIVQLFRPSQVASIGTSSPPPSEEVKIVAEMPIGPDNQIRQSDGGVVFGATGTYSGPWRNGKPFGKGTLVNYHCSNSWIYEGDVDSGLFDGEGKMKRSDESEWYKGTFRKGHFVSGKCQISAKTSETSEFYAPNGDESGLMVLYGEYRGQCIVSDTPRIEPAAGRLIPYDPEYHYLDVLVADGKGVFHFVPQVPDRSNEVKIDGEWKDGVFINGTVTNPNDNSYVEGEFRRSLVIKGEANRVAGFFYGLVDDRAWSTLAYTGQIANGLPDGQGYLFGLIHENVAKFQGIFRKGIPWEGNGRLPDGLNGGWREGILQR
jgi:hypothetical protein